MNIPSDLPGDTSNGPSGDRGIATTLASAVLDAADALIVVTDARGRIVIFNRACERLTGLARNEAIGKTLDEVFPLSDEPVPDPAATPSPPGSGRRPVQETLWLTGDRRLRHILWHHGALSDDRDGLRGAISIGLDITERLRNEDRLRLQTKALEERVVARTRELQESRRMLDSLISHLPGMVYRCRHDEHWTMEFVSDGVRPLTGYGAEDFLSRRISFAEIIHPGDREYVARMIDTQVRDRAPFQLEYRIITAGGEEKWVWERGGPVYSEDGGFLALEGFITDISQRKKAEEQIRLSNEELERRVEERTARLRESEERFRQLAENINEVFWMKTADGRTVLYVSPAYERIWGGDREALYRDATAWLAAVHPDDRPAVARTFAPPITADNLDIEYRIVRPDGTVRWIRDRAFAVRNAQGSVYRIAGIAEDITPQKEATEALARSREQLRQLALHQEMDREALRTRIAREMHDELGQSLMALNLDLHWLIRHCDDKDKAMQKAHEMLRLIERTARSVQEISSELRPIILDDLGLEAALNWQIERFIEKSGLQCEEKILSLGELEISDQYAITVYRLLQEALTNISRHARATKFSVRVTHGDSHISLLIRDNGIGITEDKLKRSDAFGLIGMRERVHALQGCLEISGEPDRGTTVSVILPLNHR